MSKTWSVFVIIVLLSGCMVFDDSAHLANKQHSRGRTLADLSLMPQPMDNSPLAEVNFIQLQTLYNNLLLEVDEPILNAKIKQRLGVLQMQQTEQAIIGQNSTTVEKISYQSTINSLLQMLDAGTSANEQLLYQLAKAYDLEGQLNNSLQTIEQLITQYPQTKYMLELQFRRAEILFSNHQYAQALASYQYVISAENNAAYLAIGQYMQGWSYFKLDQFDLALVSFNGVLDRFIAQHDLSDVTNLSELVQTVPAINRQMLEETFAIMTIAFATLNNTNAINEHYQNIGSRAYAFLHYEALGQYYLSKQRYNDSYDIYHHFVEHYPQHRATPLYALNKLAVLHKANYHSRISEEQRQLVTSYQPINDYWQGKNTAVKKIASTAIHGLTQQLGQSFHRQAQQQISQGLSSELVQASYQEAIYWYQRFLENFPADENTITMKFYLGESFYASEDYLSAANLYQDVAYQQLAGTSDAEHGVIKKEAAYALILSLQALLPATSMTDTQLGLIARQLYAKSMFVAHYLPDERALLVQHDLSLQYYQQGFYALAIDSVNLALAMNNELPEVLRRSALTIMGKSQFLLQQYPAAEQTLVRLLPWLSQTQANDSEILELLGASRYRQGEALMAQAQQLLDNNIGQLPLSGEITQQIENLRTQAVTHFTNVLNDTPTVTVSVDAEYDLATLYLAMQQWQKAIKQLQQFQLNNPQSPQAPKITAKLAFAYQQDKQWASAATLLVELWQQNRQSAPGQDMLWLAAELYFKADEKQLALAAYRDYAHSYPSPFERAVQARFILTELYQERKDQLRRDFWLKKLIQVDKNAQGQRTDRSRNLAAMASLKFANDKSKKFKAIALKLPLADSLTRKRLALEAATKAYNQTADYQVEQYTSAATYQMGDLYQHFARALMRSQRPQELNALELEQYNILLEEQTYPFEDKAIAMHELNSRRSYLGNYDPWVQQSFKALVSLLPARYSKEELVVEVINEVY